MAVFTHLALVAVYLALPGLVFGYDAQVKRLDEMMQTLQPTEERLKQDSLPKSAHPLWRVLNEGKVTYSNEEPHITLARTPAIKALAGREVSLTGFMLPMDDGVNTARTKHFMLSQRTPTCTWCPPGEPNEVVEVVVPRALEWVGREVLVVGRFVEVNNTNNGIFYRIETK